MEPIRVIAAVLGLSLAGLGALSTARAAPEAPGQAGTPARATANTADQGATPRPKRIELEFELRLRHRPRGFGPSGKPVDVWAGGRLELAEQPNRRGSYHLVRTLEDPWVFRWLDFKDEVKLGAQVSVPEPGGHPYGSLAPALEQRARRLHACWKGEQCAPVPSIFDSYDEWGAREAFWGAADPRRDALHEHPVMPFYVLGDPAGRFRFRVESDGSVAPASVFDEMSGPWLRDGPDAWSRGDDLGCGYWEPGGRPRWEPRGWQALVAALGLFELGVGENQLEAGRLSGDVARVLRALLPLGSKEVLPDSPALELTSETGRKRAERVDGRTRYRFLRTNLLAKAAGDTHHADRVLISIEDLNADGRALFLAIGYRRLRDAPSP
ncbi:hypothetical protein ABI59_17490 [Acidobacteria bacterium Mor1]|nr:hypothetical protein ABI59_17490 [Acidobacteria bacterium Mor1]